MNHLIAPHGGQLVDLLADEQRSAELKQQSLEWPSLDLTDRHLRDLELLLNGAFSPLQGFMTRADYQPVLETMRLASGEIWPIPIQLDVKAELAATLEVGMKLALRDPEGVMIAVLHVEDLWQPDRQAEAQAVFGTTSRHHPGVAQLLSQEGDFYAGGRVEGLQLPSHYDFRTLRHTPAELRRVLGKLGWKRVVAFQTRNPMHRAHQELTLRAAKEVEASLLIHPVVGLTKPGDVDHYTRVRCYQALERYYPQHTAKLSLLPLAMRMAGPREALWHAIIRKNYGCTHFIVGRDHAGPGKDADGTPFYGPYDAQELLAQHQEELGISMVPFRMLVYVEDLDAYRPIDEVQDGQRVLNISGTELRQRLSRGSDLPEWFTFPEVARELRRTYPPRHKQGFTVFFTGLSGAGQIHRSQRSLGQAARNGGAPGHPAGRRHRSQEPLLGAGFLEATPGHQHSPHRLRSVGDHQERRHRHLCSHRALRVGTPGGTAGGRSRWRLRAGARRDPDRSV